MIVSTNTKMEYLDILVIAIAICCAQASTIYPHDLRVGHLRNPLAVDSPNPRLSWKLNGYPVEKIMPKNLSQTAYQIVAASTIELLTETPDLWDSGREKTNKHVSIKYGGKIPVPGKRVYWTVRVWDQYYNSSSYANVSFWDVAYNNTQWIGQWINLPADVHDNGLKNISKEDKDVISTHPGLKPVVHLRKSFSIDSDVKQAKIYATAKGLYKLFLNGEEDIKIGQHVPVFTPGWTDYNNTIQYQVFDVTKLISRKNTIGVKLGSGWYAGYVGFQGAYGYYGKRQAFLMELHLELSNGSQVIIKTDSTWKASTACLVYSDFLHGELHYENKDRKGWKRYDYDDSQWSAVEAVNIDKDVALIADKSPPTVELESVQPQSAWEQSPGVWIYDFGMNFAGYVSLNLQNFNSSARIQLRHAEVVNPNGTIYTSNLRAARATDTYVLNDPSNRKSKLQLKPHFTYHGFRYVEVTGFPRKLDLATEIAAIRIGMRGIVNQVTSDNEMVNTLLKNIKNSQTSNLISVPTDCPQRDERLGWTGDAQLFAHTAIYNGNFAAFYTKWLRDIREAQSSAGAYPNVAPRFVDFTDGGPAWADAGIVVPYLVYRQYGDVEIIEENYDSMKKFLEYILEANPKLLWTNRTSRILGDWLNVGEDTPGHVISTAYFAYDSLLLSKMAKVVGRTADAEKYSKLHVDISNAFVKAFVNETNGKIEGDSQTGYVLALAFELLPADLAIKAVEHLVDNIRRHNYHLTTGFIGVGYLLPVLSDYGHDDVAFRLLQQTTFPSWGFMIENNATSMWEHWDGYTPEKGFFSPTMNSFNQYALGSVGRWMYQYMAGIDTDEDEVGFQKIIIKPHIGDHITLTEATYESVQGLITTRIRMVARNCIVEVSIPVNTQARIILPFMKQKWERDVPSGNYTFIVSL